MYIPKHHHWIFPVSTSLLGFYLAQHTASTYDVVLTFLALQAQSIMHGIYIWRAGEMYQGYITRAEERQMVRDINTYHAKPEAKPAPAPVISDGLKPIIRVDGKVAYAQATTQPKFDKERYLAFTLCRMHDNGFKVDLTEARWVRGWKFSRSEFVAVLDKWRDHGLIERAGEKRNSSYEVRRWEAVKLVADGNPLPL